jgi:hypothetical protein
MSEFFPDDDETAEDEYLALSAQVVRNPKLILSQLVDGNKTTILPWFLFRTKSL